MADDLKGALAGLRQAARWLGPLRELEASLDTAIGVEDHVNELTSQRDALVAECNTLRDTIETEGANLQKILTTNRNEAVEIVAKAHEEAKAVAAKAADDAVELAHEARAIVDKAKDEAATITAAVEIVERNLDAKRAEYTDLQQKIDSLKGTIGAL